MLSRRSLAALALVPVMPAIGVAAVPRDPIGGVCRNAATWRTLPYDNAADFCQTEPEVIVPRTVASMRRLIDDQVALWGAPDPDDPWASWSCSYATVFNGWSIADKDRRRP
jgi:hypothetical protein